MSGSKRKTLRSFYCEDDLWQQFVDMGQRVDHSMDRLLNDAMRAYLSQGATASQPTHKQAAAPPTSTPSAPAPAPPPPAAAPAPPPPPSAAPARPSQPLLFLHYGGQRYPVQQERFVIGRGTQGTDLTIRDGNISRRHAAVIFHSGNYYIQDLGSTNGIEYRGNRIETKKIEEGDAFRICDHEFRFSFRG